MTRKDGTQPGGLFGTRTTFAGVAFDDADQDRVIAWLRSRSSADAFAYVVTPNADHVVRLDEQANWDEMQAAYREADVCLCDSRVMRLLGQLLGKQLTVTSGSDLVARLLPREVTPGQRLALIGGDPATRDVLARIVPQAEVVQHVPPMGLIDNSPAMDAAAAFGVAAGADYVLLAVGSPQQEIVAHRIAANPEARGTGLCIGASVDFITGRAQRAPLWMRRFALEWLHRLLSNPKRLWRRYLLHCPRILHIALSR